MEEVVNLKQKRGIFKSKLTIFEKFFQKATSKLVETESETKFECISEIEMRLANLYNIINDFDNIQTLIEMQPSASEDEAMERQEFEDRYFSIVSQAKILLQKHQVLPSASHTSNLQRSSNSNISNSNIKLPSIKIPMFSGSYEEWLEFQHIFDSLVNKNTDILPTEKFHYLKASLSGDAAKVITSLDFTGDNFETAWNLLCERYANKKLLVYNHVKSIFNEPMITKESSKQLRSLIDNVSSHVRALKTLQQPVESWDVLLNFIIIKKLDSAIVHDWEAQKHDNDLPTFNELMEFLKQRASIIEKYEFTDSKHMKPHSFQQTKNKPVPQNRTLFTSNKEPCSYCGSNHRIFKCPEFLQLTIKSRNDIVRKLKLCRNCLNSWHPEATCKFSCCRVCSAKHNTLLHSNENAQTKQKSQTTNQPTADHQSQYPGSNPVTNTQGVQDADANVSLSNYNHQNILHNYVMLSTVLIQIKRADDHLISCRAILDSGSQSNYITEELCQKLDVDTKQIHICVQGIGRTNSIINKQCNVTIQSMNYSFTADMSCLVTPTICSCIPTQYLDTTSLQIPSNIQLADPSFNIPSKIDLLIGAGLFWQLLCIGQIQLGTGKPTLQKTKLGWILSGNFNLNHYSNQDNVCNFSQDQNESDQLTRFWSVEECPSEQLPWSDEQMRCELHFQSTFRRHSDGHFIVSIPMKYSYNKLGESKHIAMKRFFSLERRLQSNSKLRELYIQFMSEYESLGHMSKIDDTTDSESIKSYYMPHHGVLRESSVSTKLRVVFNASSLSDSGLSFNDCQLVGPTIQSDLFSILIRFRQYKYVVSADIEKMYRMIWVDEKQRPLQRILWRQSPSDPLNTYQLNTVTYGTASAPFLAIRSLTQLAISYKSEYPDACSIIENSFYVDDLLQGHDDKDVLTELSLQVSLILSRGGFNLRKWIANDSEIISSFAETNSDALSLDLNAHENAKTLGITWSPQRDELIINTSSTFKPMKVTKRTLLSEISQIFDPLGLLCPSIIIAKVLIQKLWLQKLSWDESLPIETHQRWVKFRNELSQINNMSIPRHVRCTKAISSEIHAFSDSSESAYGACVYIRSINHQGKITCNLLCAKSKVAPTKTLSIPRLELCGALISVRLTQKVRRAIKENFDSIYFWTDSTIVLGWIDTEPIFLKTFVATRVSEIQTKTNTDHWFHVNSESNPADLLSRGLNPKSLAASSLWWYGPEWLSQGNHSWPINTYNHRLIAELPELKPVKQKNLLTHNEDTLPFNRFSNYNRLVRTIAYCLRFKQNCSLTISERNLNCLTVEEIDRATFCIIKKIQLESFRDEIAVLSKGKSLHKQSKLLSLQPFLDDENILRVGGRLSNSKFSFSKQHPILLPSNHSFTRLLFEVEHKKHLHVGPQQLLYLIRETFWPINGRNLARKTFRNCIQCFRVNPNNNFPQMGNLPETRVSNTLPFITSGVDYCGPFQIKDRKNRNYKTIKVYVCVFVCFSTKAVHVELVSDQTSEAFIAALKRFIARRGKPKLIISDNGTTFVGAFNELSQIIEHLKSESGPVFQYCSSEHIKWKFIPTYSPHFGGLWEAGIKSIKTHLKRVIGESKLTFEEFYTFLTQVEAILNSRPLTPMSSHPTDLQPITPSHFLIGRTITSVPECNSIDVASNRLTSFKKVEQMKQHFWRRWHLEYISELQLKNKWKQNQATIQVDTLVLIKDKRHPPLQWSLGRVIELHPGQDGITRVVSIKTTTGIVKRAVVTICPLPIVSEG